MTRQEFESLLLSSGASPTFPESSGKHAVSINCNGWQPQGHDVWTHWHDTEDAAIAEALSDIEAQNWTQHTAGADYERVYPSAAVVAALIPSIVSPGDRVIEIGAGSGAPSVAAADAGADVHATDIDENAVNALLSLGLNAYALDYLNGSPPSGPWSLGIATACDYSEAQVAQAASFLAGCERAVIAIELPMNIDGFDAAAVEQAHRCNVGGPFVYLHTRGIAR